jgi:hypothetical protein
MRVAALPLLVLLAACPQPDPDPDPEPEGCGDDLVEGAFELGSDGATQIHPRSAFAGGRVWTAYNAEDPEGGSDFVSFVVAHACDGSLAAGPIRLSEAAGNAVDPDIVASQDRLLVAWQLDDGGAPWNLAIHTAVLDLEGELVGPDAPLEMEREGAPYEGNAWMPRVAALPDGFALSGSRGVGNSFQAFVQRLDLDGVPAEPSIDLDLDPAVSQLESAIVADPDGGLHVAWATDLTEGDVRGAELAPGAATATAASWDRSGGGLRLARTGSGETLLAGHGTGAGGFDVFLAPWEQGPLFVIDDEGLQHSPGIATGDGATLLLWHDGPQVAADLFGIFLDDEGEPLADDFELPFTDPVAGYPADAVHAGGDAFFVSWSQGDSPDLTLRGAFVRP